MEIFFPLSSQKGLTLICNFQKDGLPYLVGDPLRLSRIIINLVSNAIKYTEAGSVTIDITWHLDGAEVMALECRVKDTGIGIPEDRIEHVFKEFTQADASITRR